MPLPTLKFNEQEPRRTTATGWKKLERRIDAMPEAWREGELLLLDGLRTIKMKETATDIYVLAELLAEAKCVCGASKSKIKKNGFTEPCLIYDLPVRHKRVNIYYRVQRYLCYDCGESFQQSFTGCSAHHRMTERLLAYLEKTSLNIYTTFSQIARETGVREHVIRNIFTDQIERLYRERVIVLPAWIAIDEMHPASGRHKRLVISDPVNGKILDILGSDSQAGIEEWFRQTENPGGVRVVSMDMHVPYKSAVEKILPKAEIVADRYHAQKLVNKSLKAALRIMARSLTVTERKERIRSSSILLKSRHDLREQEEKTLNRWFFQMPDLAWAYTLKEDFADLLHLCDESLAVKQFALWLERIEEYNRYFGERYKKRIHAPTQNPFGNIIISMGRDWTKQILNYIKYKNEFSTKVTNAFAEYANNQIKKGYRLGNGYHFPVLRAKVIFGDFLREKFVPQPLKPVIKRGRRTWIGKDTISSQSNVNRIVFASDSRNKILQERIEANPINKMIYRRRMDQVVENKPLERHYDPLGEPRSVETQEAFPKISIRQRESKVFINDKKVPLNHGQISLFERNITNEIKNLITPIVKKEFCEQQSLFN